MHRSKLGIRLSFFIGAFVLVFLAGALHWTPWSTTYKASFMLVSYGVLFIGFIGVWLSFPDGLSRLQKIGLIMLVSLIARMVMIGVPESDDMYRYLWEGKIVAAGESPYQFPADHQHYVQYRDAYWEGMNHKDKLTAYPPLAQLIFAGVSDVAYTPLAFKLLFIIADLCVIGVLMALLSQRGLDLRNTLLYALNPLALFAIAGEGHFDVLLILTMMLSVLCVERRSFAWAWFWLGVAIQIKIVALVLVPLYLWRCHWRYCGILLIPLILPSLYFIQTIPGMFQGLWTFGGTNAFNGPIHGPINYLLGGDTILATSIVFMLFGFIALWAIWAVKTPARGAYFLIAALVLLSPVVHYWYVLWVIPFVVLYPSLSWLVLSLTSGAYFVSIFSVEQGGEWGLPVWAMVVIWLPFLLILFYELRIVLLRQFQKEAIWPQPETLAIIVPTLNEGQRIEACLSALLAQKRPVDEIIVSDGGSNDETVAIVKSMGVRVITSKPGRGYQIQAGVEVAGADVVWIVHADCICDEDVSGRIMTVLKQNPDVSGGAVGQRFVAASVPLHLIEMLNDARAILGGASFGDQGQFFRVAAIQRVGGFPDYPLMEDVELSLRMMRVGKVVMLDGGIRNSARQWRQGFIQRTLLIIRLVIVFRLARLFRRDVTQKLYAIYYGGKYGD